MRLFLILFILSGSLFSCYNKTIEFSKNKINGISLVAPVHAVGDSIFTPINQLNSNYISLMPYAFTKEASPYLHFNIHRQWWGEKDEGIIRCTQMAKDQKLQVMLKPHIWIGHDSFTGYLDFANDSLWHLWEQSYSNYILHFARLADSLNIEVFCFGTELKNHIKERPTYWHKLLKQVRSRYKGKITYAANWDNYQNIPFWNELDFIGVNAYFPLDNAKTPSTQELVKNWQPIAKEIEALVYKVQKPVLFTEYGYRSVDYTAKEPWQAYQVASYNELAQEHAFKALYLTFWHKPWFAGGFIWKWYPSLPNTERLRQDYSPQGKSVEKMIKQWHSM